ncbi:MAG: hypothetical protein HY319_18120 [Armatimonadetes bacterium]|nr:hypothetical protein [Armatimonadota bacterium]
MEISSRTRSSAAAGSARAKPARPGGSAKPKAKAKRQKVKEKAKTTARKLRRPDTEVDPCGGTDKSKKVSKARKNRTNGKNRLAGASWKKVRERLAEEQLPQPLPSAADSFAATTLVLSSENPLPESPSGPGCPTRIACF